MKMKSLLFAASAALAVSLQAEVEANNTLCRIMVESSAKSIIVAVPLVAVGSGDVKVTDYIMTTNLKNGDSILKWNSTDSKWDGWVIQNGSWSAVASVSGYNNVNTTAPAADSALERGAAVWLNRSDETISASNQFYLYGQISDSSVTLTATAGGYTLLGNPKTENLDLSQLSWSNCAEGDQIIFASESSTPRIYVYKSNAWSKIVNDTDSNGMPTTTVTALTQGEVTLAPGTGFWYNSVGESNPTVTIQ